MNLVDPVDPGPDDAALVALLRANQPGAAELLWDRYARLVRAVIRRAIWQPGDDDDLVQEVFLRVFRNLRSLREPHALRAFLLTVTSSVIASELRRRKVRRFLGLTARGELPDIAAPARDDDGREALVAVYAVLDRVTHEERMAFILRTVEGLELPEVAQILGLSIATVKRRFTRVNERIRRVVQRDPQLALVIEKAGRREVRKKP